MESHWIRYLVYGLIVAGAVAGWLYWRYRQAQLVRVGWGYTNYTVIGFDREGNPFSKSAKTLYDEPDKNDKAVQQIKAWAFFNRIRLVRIIRTDNQVAIYDRDMQ